MTQTFKKPERLCRKKAIEALFEKGSSFYNFPLQVIWLESPTESVFPAQVAFSVSKKSFRRAVIRNLIKRRMREAYRKNKQSLYLFLESQNKKIVFFIIYKGDYIPDYLSVEELMRQVLEKLISELKR